MYSIQKMINLNGKDVLLDPLSIALAHREIYMTGEVNEGMADLVRSQLYCLAREDPNAPITLYIQGPGGSIAAGMSIYDTAKSIPCEIRTVACGLAASMDAFLVCAAGTKGMRYIQPHAEMLIHQPLSGIQGQASDIRIHAEHVLALRGKLNRIMAEATGQSLKTIERDTERDKIMDAEAALAYGLVDKIGDPFVEE